MFTLILWSIWSMFRKNVHPNIMIYMINAIILRSTWLMWNVEGSCWPLSYYSYWLMFSKNAHYYHTILMINVFNFIFLYDQCSERLIIIICMIVTVQGNCSPISHELQDQNFVYRAKRWSARISSKFLLIFL